jgi:hypothetical protein
MVYKSGPIGKNKLDYSGPIQQLQDLAHRAVQHDLSSSMIARVCFKPRTHHLRHEHQASGRIETADSDII